MPADGHTLPHKGQDFGTSRRQHRRNLTSVLAAYKEARMAPMAHHFTTAVQHHTRSVIADTEGGATLHRSFISISIASAFGVRLTARAAPTDLQADR
jgi:hypothetical protein